LVIFVASRLGIIDVSIHPIIAVRNCDCRNYIEQEPRNEPTMVSRLGKSTNAIERFMIELD
jgi:hypothetical protein